MKRLILFLIFSSVFSIEDLSATPYQYGRVVTSQHLATKVGQEILNRGGNAIDAAVAVGYALSVVEPCCGNLGGGGFMLIRLHNGQTQLINFRERAPLHANSKMYFDKNGKLLRDRIESGYLSVATPGTVMGLNAALEKYGRFPLKKVIAPAINLAEKGFILVPGDVELIRRAWEQLQKDPKVKTLLSKDGHMLQVGSRFIQKDLAATLKQIAKDGTDAFYKGKIAEQIVASSQKHGGILTMDDFLKYHIAFQKPIKCFYRGYEVISAPPPSSGGVVLCEMLQISSGYPLSKLGYHTPQGTHYILESMRFSYADRTALGDPDFVNNPVNELISEKHANHIRNLIQSDKATPSSQILIEEEKSQEKSQTTHYSIVDREGNAVSVTYTLNGYFGAKVIADDTGIFLNNEMDDFSLGSKVENEFSLIQGKNNEIQPLKRPLSSMTPTILLKDNQLFMVLGAPGGSTIPTQVLETIENVIDYHLPFKKAVDAPRYHMQWWPDVVYTESDAFSKNTTKALEQMGYHFQIGSPFHTPQWGAVAAILLYPEKGESVGAIDVRRPSGLVE